MQPNMQWTPAFNFTAGSTSEPLLNRKIAKASKKKITPDERSTIMKTFERKIIKPVKKNVAPDLRNAILEDQEPARYPQPFEAPRRSESLKLSNETKEEAEQMGQDDDVANAFDEAARAMAEAPRDSDQPPFCQEFRRKKHTEQLASALQDMVKLIRQKNMKEKRTYVSKLKAQRKYEEPLAPFIDNPLIHLDAELLAKAWEAKLWLQTGQKSQGYVSYVEQMESEIADLELWVDFFNFELEGYNVFQEHFFRHFGNDEKYLKATALSSECQEPPMISAKPVSFTAGSMKAEPTVVFRPAATGFENIRDTVFGVPGTTVDQSSMSRTPAHEVDVEEADMEQADLEEADTDSDLFAGIV